MLFAPRPGLTAEPPGLNDQIKKLTDALGVDPAAAAKDAEVQKSLLALLARIDAAACDSAASSNAACKIQQLTSLATGAVAALKDKSVKITDQQITDLHTALDPVLKIVPPDDDVGLLDAVNLATAIANGPNPVASPPDVVTALDKLIQILQTKITAAKPATALPADKRADATKTIGDVSTNVGLILKALGANDDLIRVRGAWYGDLNAIRDRLTYGAIASYESTARYCSATRAVRARCQGKAQCYEPADAAGASANAGDGSTAEIDGPHMCGYEPAPFADPSNKGLIVRYDCLSAQDGTWMTAALDDDRIPGNASGKLEDKSPGKIPLAPIEQGSNLALLRANTLALIRCQPVSLAAAAAAAAAKDTTDAGSAPGAKKAAAPATPTGTIAITVSGTVPGTVTGTATGTTAAAAAGAAAPATGAGGAGAAPGAPK
jgi:hypothetical protein